MLDSTSVTEPSTPTNSGALWPTYALRAWLTAILAQLEKARDDIDASVEYHEKEITRLKSQRERSVTVITSLRDSIISVDDVLRRKWDNETQPQSPPDDTGEAPAGNSQSDTGEEAPAGKESAPPKPKSESRKSPPSSGPK